MICCLVIKLELNWLGFDFRTENVCCVFGQVMELTNICGQHFPINTFHNVVKNELV